MEFSSHKINKFLIFWAKEQNKKAGQKNFLYFRIIFQAGKLKKNYPEKISYISRNRTFKPPRFFLYNQDTFGTLTLTVQYLCDSPSTSHPNLI